MAYASGELKIKIRFSDLYVEDDSESSVLDAVFPDGWDGELDVQSMDVDIDEDDEEDY